MLRETHTTTSGATLTATHDHHTPLLGVELAQVRLRNGVRALWQQQHVSVQEGELLRVITEEDALLHDK